MAVAIGVDVGGTKVLAAAVDAADPATVLAERRVPTPAGGDGVVEAVAGAAQAVADELRAAGRGAPAGVGVGLPGLLDRVGTLHAAPNLPAAVGVPVGRLLGRALDVPVVVENDANCAAWAEVLAGAGRGAADAVLVTLGTGIGGGIVLGGQLLRGTHGFAGEPGHMVVDPSGPECPCGRRGCWERYASGSGLGWLGERAARDGRAPALLDLAAGDPGAVRGEHVTRAARGGDAGAGAVLEEFSWWLAAGLANLVDLLDPEVVLVGGGLAEEAELFLDRTRASLAEQVLGSAARRRTRLDVAILGPAAGAIGAALLSLEATSTPTAG